MVFQCVERKLDEDTTRNAVINGQHNLCLLLTLARLDALNPRMVKVCVAGISAFPEPITATSATARFARFLKSTTFGAYAIDSVGSSQE